MKTSRNILLFSLVLTMAACGGRTKKNVAEEEVAIIEGRQVKDISEARLSEGVVDTLDLGLVELLDTYKVEAALYLRNAGDKPLVILQDKKSCNCIRTTYSRKPVQPGDTSELKVEFDPKGLSGKVYKPVRFTTNLSDKEYSLVVTAVVK